MANSTTKSITIYQKSYQLPILEEGYFQHIQSQIKQRQEVIKNQKRVIIEQKQVQKKALFGLLSNTETVKVQKTQDLSFEDNLHELERLVHDYNQLIDYIAEYKQIYLQFFAQLTSDLKQFFREKLAEISQQEKERLDLLAGEQDNELIDILEEQKEKIVENTWLLGQAFLLILKKIELMSEGMEKITTDQDSQRQLLIEIVEKLGKYKKVYSFKRKINKSDKISDTEVNFEQYLKPFIDSFQELTEQICQQDRSLSGVVKELKSLVEDMMESKTGAFMSDKVDDLSKNMLGFLIDNEQQKIDIKNCRDGEDLKTAISVLQAHIDEKLGNYRQELASLIVGAQGLRPTPLKKDERSPLHFLEKERTFVELESEKNIDYQLLDSLLSQEKWREADKETADLMLQAMGKTKWWDVSQDDLSNFPITDLSTMNQLWLNYSDGKFGFSVQKQIWLDCGGKVGVYDYEAICKFADQVQWRKDGNWLSYDQIRFTNDAIKGHLPEWTCVRGIGFMAFLSSRL